MPGKRKRKNGKRENRLISVPVMVLIVFCFCVLLVPGSVQASGIIGFEANAGHGYSTYSLDHYDLDFYVDMSWSWLPWNWGEAVGRSVSYAFYALTNGIWYISRLLSYGTGEIVEEAYRFDILNELTDSLAVNVQKLAGVSQSGFSATGFLPGFLMLIIAVTGVYVAYMGLYKREISKAIGAVINEIVVFIVLITFVVYAPDCIRSLNDLSTDICTQSLEIGTQLVLGDAGGGTGDSVDMLRDELFEVQVYQPWLLMQYGTTDINAIGAERVNSLVAVSPDAEYGQTRENVVKAEIETYQNMRMTVPKVMTRFGEALLIFLVNLIISVFVILLSGLMILSQILFIVYVMFLVISLVLSMFPGCSGMAKKSVLKVFNVIMLRAGYVLIMTVAFTISTMIYKISANHSFIVIGFLQIIVFAGIFLNKNEILGFMSLQTDRGVSALGLAGGALVYQKARRKAYRRERKAEARRDRMVQQAGKMAVNAGGMMVRGGAEIVGKLNDRRAMNFYRTRAADAAVKKHHQRSTLDYSAAGNTPKVSADGARFHEQFSEKTPSSGKLYDRYFERIHGRNLEKMRPYKVSSKMPETGRIKLQDRKSVEASRKYKRPELWQRNMDVGEVRERYAGKVPKQKNASSAASSLQNKPEVSGNRTRYHVSLKENVPQAERLHGSVNVQKNEKKESMPSGMAGQQKPAEKINAGNRYRATSKEDTPRLERQHEHAGRQKSEAVPAKINRSENKTGTVRKQSYAGESELREIRRRR